MQLCKVLGDISNLGSLHSSIEVSVGVLTIVVAVAGGEQLDHVGRIVVVHDPAVTGNIVLTCTASSGEGRPLHLVDGQGNTQIAPSLLQVLCQRHMVAGIVGAVLDGGVALAIGVASLFQQLLSLGHICLVVISNVGRAAVRVIVEVALRVHDARADQVGSSRVGALHDGVGNIVAVDSQSQSLTDLGILEGIMLQVQADVVGAQNGVNIEVAAVLCLGQAGDLVGGHVLDQDSLAAVVSCIASGRVLQQQQGDGVRDDLGAVPAANVVGVLGQDDTLGGGPLGDHVGAVGDEGLSGGAPCIAVGLNGSLLHRAHGCECSHLVEVGAGVGQHDGQGLAVVACLNVQSIGVGLRGGVAVCIGEAGSFFKAVDHAQAGLCIGSSGIGVDHTLEGVLKVLSGQVGAIAPLQAVTHGEGPSQAVLACFPALSLAANNFVVLVDDQQGLEDGDDGVGAINSAVQRGIQSLGVGAVLDGKTSGVDTAGRRASSGRSSAGGCGRTGLAAATGCQTQSSGTHACNLEEITTRNAFHNNILPLYQI